MSEVTNSAIPFPPLDEARLKVVSTRRQFISGFVAVGATAVFVPNGFASQTAGTTKRTPRRIDVHHHPTVPPNVTGATRAANTFEAFRTGPASADWTVSKALEEMDQGGVDLTILSTGGNDAAHCRAFNEYTAKLVSDHPERFGMFASLPFPDVDGCLKEIAYGMDVLKADGVRLGTSYPNKLWLGDGAFAPIFEELNRRKAVLYTHPGAPACCTNLVPGIGDSTIEFGTDTARAIVKMVFSGSSARYPDMKIIFSHAGGTMPYLVLRGIKDSLGSGGPVGPKNEVVPPVPNGFVAEVRRFYYDTAQAAGGAAMSALKKVVPVSHIVFGTDFPWISAAETAKGLKDSGVFTSQELAQIDSGNALRLFPKYAS
jgi:predicted TIM-barrel fold metal-dependent hydrolase